MSKNGKEIWKKHTNFKKKVEKVVKDHGEHHNLENYVIDSKEPWNKNKCVNNFWEQSRNRGKSWIALGSQLKEKNEKEIILRRDNEFNML